MRLNFFGGDAGMRIVKRFLNLIAKPRIVLGVNDVNLVVDDSLRYRFVT
jgi:hypothetical protein